MIFSCRVNFAAVLAVSSAEIPTTTTPRLAYFFCICCNIGISFRHGGQVVIPGVGAVARRRFPVLSGLGSRDNTWMFVSRGIGTVYVPIRINCPPEVAIVTLKRKSEI